MIPKKQPPRGLKIVNEGNVSNNVRVYALIDGQELDISTIVQKVDVKLHVGELATANLQVVVYSVETKALLEQLNVNEPFRHSRLRKLRRRLIEVTHFGSRARSYAR